MDSKETVAGTSLVSPSIRFRALFRRYFGRVVRCEGNGIGDVPLIEALKEPVQVLGRVLATITPASRSDGVRGSHGEREECMQKNSVAVYFGHRLAGDCDLVG